MFIIQNVRKYLWLLAIGIFTAVILYPFLHESGHLLLTLLLGGQIKEFSLLPTPNVLCDVGQISKAGIIIAGFAGAVMPFLISLICSSRSFTVWYILQIIKCISLLAFSISLTSLLGEKHGIIITTDDIINVLRFWPDGKGMCVFIVAALMLLAVYSIFAQKPLERIYSYFNI